MANRFASLLAFIAQFTGLCLVIALGLEAALTRDPACLTVFSIALGVVIALSIPSGPASEPLHTQESDDPNALPHRSRA